MAQRKATDEGVRQLLSQLLDEDMGLTEQLTTLERRRQQVRTAIQSLASLENNTLPEFEGGLAPAVRAVLSAAPDSAFSASDIRTGLKILKYDVSKHTNVLASIHSVCKRMHDNNELTATNGEDGPRYQWNNYVGTIGELLGLKPPPPVVRDTLEDQLTDNLVREKLAQPLFTEPVGGRRPGITRRKILPEDK